MGLFRAYFYLFITYFQLSFRTFVLPVSSVWTTIWHNQSAEKWEAEWINLESEVIRICDAQWSLNLLHSWNDGKLTSLLNSFQPVQWTHTSIISISRDSSLWTKRSEKMRLFGNKCAKSCTFANLIKTWPMSSNFAWIGDFARPQGYP